MHEVKRFKAGRNVGRRVEEMESKRNGEYVDAYRLIVVIMPHLDSNYF